MKNYTLGLDKGGKLISFVLGIKAKDIRSAAIEWARLTGHLGAMFNPDERTYFIWKVVETKQIPLQRKDGAGVFSY